VQLAEKIASRGYLNADTPCHLVHSMDKVSKRRFLVDSGASYTIFPYRSSSPHTGPLLAGSSGKTILCWVEKEFELSFDKNKFKWLLLLAAINFPILGVDFLRHHCLNHQLPTVATTALTTIIGLPIVGSVNAGPASTGPASTGLASTRPASTGPVSARAASPGPDSCSPAESLPPLHRPPSRWT
jgi:hypothetical protein